MKISLIIKRVYQAILLEIQSLITPYCGFEYAYLKWVSVIKNKRSISFLGRKYYYEDRLQPFTLFNYINEIIALNKIFGFRGGRVLDIGANIGNFGYTLMILYPNSSVWSFEPNPVPFNYLKSNSNFFKDWRIFNFGISNSTSNNDFYYMSGKSGQGSIYEENASLDILKSNDIIKSSVLLRPLSSQFLQKECGGESFDLVKIDVEGAELLAIDGLKDVQWKFMYVELSNNRSGSTSLEKLISLISETNPNARVIKLNLNKYFTDVYLSNID